MILKEFSKYIKKFNDEIPTELLLLKWLKITLSKKPLSLTDKIINQEIALNYCENKDFPFKGKTKTGKILLESLYNYAQSYEQQKFSRWIHTIKASDFININNKKQ